MNMPSAEKRIYKLKANKCRAISELKDINEAAETERPRKFSQPFS
jgi:hypothetical protein